MEFFRLEGLVLRSVPLGERDRLLSVLTGSHGLIGVVLKPGTFGHGAFASTFVEGELLVAKYKSELFRFREGRVLTAHRELFHSEQVTAVAEEIQELFLSSRWRNRAIDELYLLVQQILKALPLVTAPQTLFALLQVRVLALEGVFQWEPVCCSCSRGLPPSSFRYAGMRFCESDAPLGALPFSHEEEAQLCTLRRAFHVHEIALLGVEEKVAALFAQSEWEK